METKTPHSKILLYQAVGFLGLIALSWFVELTDLHSLILGNHPYISDFRESTLEMLLVLGVWFIVASSTRRALDHVRYLQGFMRICSWCHHIDYKGEWVPMEEFLHRGFDTPTTHGICPICLAKQKAAIEEARKAAAPVLEGEASASLEPQPGANQPTGTAH
jgi:hypothetical protein